MLLGPTERHPQKATSPKSVNTIDLYCQLYGYTGKTKQNKKQENIENEETEEYVPNKGIRPNLRNRTKQRGDKQSTL